ncbi:glycosyl transferase family 2 [Gallibacterium genomosp. 2]|uniref:Glycosyl transferase family 2 n=1 Tax=Gallibacterium genomosp. 2 TaxID=155517 RepID=A0A0A2XPZ2_9PAST|nr:glycosyl transferase family 2 [Gallibacterium genomosp. 2]KGQ34263.1 glycosyl transferase family 2 [Gallibacterium genomosp. 2]
MNQPKKHWAAQQERGTVFFLNLTRLIVAYLPLWAIRIATFVVVSYFFATSKKARQHIAAYQTRLCQTFPEIRLPRWAVFRQFLTFGEAITDRFAVWQNKITYQDLQVDDADNLYHDIDHQGRGQILLCSHFGNIEICRALADNGHHPHFVMNVLVHSHHAQAFNEALEKAGAKSLPLIQVTDLDAQKMLELQQRLERGEWIAIAADRVPVRGDKTQKADFLGTPADFPQGAWLLAALLKAPLNSVFCIKTPLGYRLKLRRFCPAIFGRGAVRQQQIDEAMQRYADLLAQECHDHPLQWFNFYDFWNDNSQ